MNDESQEVLTVKQAYRTMFRFLEGYYSRLGAPDVLGVLLGGFSLRPNGYTMDPAAWYDWLEAIAAVRQEDAQENNTAP